MSTQRTPSYDFIIKQGATFKRRIRIKVDGIVQPLTGSLVQLFFRPFNSQIDLVLSSDDPPSIEEYLIIDITVPTSHFIEIFFSDEITETFTWTYADYRLEFTDTLGAIRRKLKGRLIMELKPT